MTLTAPSTGRTPDHDVSGVLLPDQLPPLPGRGMAADELLVRVREVASCPDLWEQHVAHDTDGRHYVSLHRDADVDIRLLCWNLEGDTGWHDHHLSAGARSPGARSARAGSVDGSVSIHAYSPPPWRMGRYAIGAGGEMRRVSVSYAEELRPFDA